MEWSEGDLVWFDPGLGKIFTISSNSRFLEQFLSLRSSIAWRNTGSPSSCSSHYRTGTNKWKGEFIDSKIFFFFHTKLVSHFLSALIVLLHENKK